MVFEFAMLRGQQHGPELEGTLAIYPLPCEGPSRVMRVAIGRSRHKMSRFTHGRPGPKCGTQKLELFASFKRPPGLVIARGVCSGHWMPAEEGLMGDPGDQSGTPSVAGID